MLYKRLEKLKMSSFLLLYFVKYFVYGYLFLILMTISTLFMLLGFNIHVVILRIMIVSLAIVATGYSLIRFVNIIASTKYKWRYYNLSVYRLKTRGFREKYFKNEMCEPCFRLIIRDLLKRNNEQDKYIELRKKYSNETSSIDEAKSHLIASLMEREIAP